MSDNNNDKDPLENLFRKKAVEYENISYNEADWLKLENKLEIRQLQSANRRRQLWIATAAIVILSLLGYFTYENRMHLNELNQLLSDDSATRILQDTTEEEVTDGEKAAPVEDLITGEDVPAGVDETPGDDMAPVEEMITGEDEDITPVEKMPSVEDVFTDEDVTSLEGVTPGEDANNGLQTADNNIQIVDKTGDGAVRENDGAEANLKLPPLYSSDWEKLYPDPIAQFRQAEGTETKELEMETETDGTTTDGRVTADRRTIAGEEPVVQSAGQRSPRVSIGLMISPDMSTVGSFSNFTDPGYKIGVNVEYRLSRNLSIATGIVHSQVRYQAFGDDYRPPRDYRTNQDYNSGATIPDEAFADCVILDIPVNVKYDFVHLGRSRFFASAGLSTYIMLREDYRFGYETAQSGQLQELSVQSGNRHWMSNAGFSVGYEVDLLPNWSLRAEPFVKVPLREVGWGNVNLYSLGSFASLNYHFR